MNSWISSSRYIYLFILILVPPCLFLQSIYNKQTNVFQTLSAQTFLGKCNFLFLNALGYELSVIVICWKTHQKRDEISRWKYTQTQTHGNLRYFSDHRCLSLSEESKCMWTHGKMASCDRERHLWSPKYLFPCVCVYFHPEISSLFCPVFPFIPFIELSNHKVDYIIDSDTWYLLW